VILGILASGEGTTLQAVLDACACGELAAQLGVVISNNSPVVTAEYDAGPTLAQRTVPLRLDDTADTLAERVQAAERLSWLTSSPRSLAEHEGCQRSVTSKSSSEGPHDMRLSDDALLRERRG
jgi:folate-dependent phosphoribosylglycinamide formyltransferase PurN